MLEMFGDLQVTTDSGGAEEVEVRVPLFADAGNYPKTSAGDIVRKVSVQKAKNP